MVVGRIFRFRKGVNMQDRTLNFILVLVTGRVWGQNIKNLKGKSVDLWDCEPWMDFILLHFMPHIIPYSRYKRLRIFRQDR